MLLLDSRHGLTLRYLLGTHELELHPAIEGLIAAGLGTVINCGAAHGYYAIGCALRCPSARVVAFEAVEYLHQAITLAARANGVAGRIAIRGWCDAATLRDSVASASSPILVVADMEGNESNLFDGETAARLARASILIETHDDLVPGTTERLLARFAPTHVVEVYSPRARTRDDLPDAILRGPWRLIVPLLLWLVKEYRPRAQRWLLFTPRETR